MLGRSRLAIVKEQKLGQKRSEESQRFLALRVAVELD